MVYQILPLCHQIFEFHIIKSFIGQQYNNYYMDMQASALLALPIFLVYRFLSDIFWLVSFASIFNLLLLYFLMDKMFVYLYLLVNDQL